MLCFSIEQDTTHNISHNVSFTAKTSNSKQSENKRWLFLMCYCRNKTEDAQTQWQCFIKEYSKMCYILMQKHKTYKAIRQNTRHMNTFAVVYQMTGHNWFPIVGTRFHTHRYHRYRKIGKRNTSVWGLHMLQTDRLKSEGSIDWGFIYQ